jgi:hypothetical protein
MAFPVVKKKNCMAFRSAQVVIVSRAERPISVPVTHFLRLQLHHPTRATIASVYPFFM